MAEYFKFCPKCGRVLDRDFCSHCEPEKEKAYRRQQQNYERGMLEDYSRDTNLNNIFSLDRKKKKVKYPGKTATKVKKLKTSGMGSLTKKEKSGKKKKIRLAVVIVIILSFLSSFLTSFSSLIGNIDLPDFLPDFIEQKLPVSTGSDDDTITESRFRDLSYDEDVQDYGFKIRYDYMEDDDGHSRIQYKVGDEEYQYSISRPIISDRDGYGVGGEAQDAIDEICQQWYDEGVQDKQDKVKVDAYLMSYTTYLDENYACIVLSGSKYYDDADSKYSLYSFIIDLNDMKVLDPSEGITFDDDFYDTMSDAAENNSMLDVSRDNLEDMIENGEYSLAFDRKGSLWVCMILGSRYQENVNIQYSDVGIEDL